MPDTGDKGIFDGAVLGPFGQGFVDGGIVDFGLSVLVFEHRPTLPLHAGVEPPPDEVEEAMIAEFALGTALGHREVGQDKWIELSFGEVHGNRRGSGLLGRHGHDEMALFEEGLPASA